MNQLAEPRDESDEIIYGQTAGPLHPGLVAELRARVEEERAEKAELRLQLDVERERNAGLALLVADVVEPLCKLDGVDGVLHDPEYGDILEDHQGTRAVWPLRDHHRALIERLG